MNKKITPTSKSEAELLAFSTILGGLLASGHFTVKKDDEFPDERPNLKRDFFEVDHWISIMNQPCFYARDNPYAFELASELYKASKRYITLTNNKQPTQK